MCRFLFCFLLLLSSGGHILRAGQSYKPEYIVITGGPSLIEWEKFKRVPHDHWWANFVHASRIRLGELRQTYGDTALITWLVYKPAYLRRGSRQEKTDLIAQIRSVQQKLKLHLVFFNTKEQLVNYLNAGQPRDSIKIADMEYFGHSNRACFMFDYSNEIDSGSKAWLHEKELFTVHRNDFARRAFIKSWGCHTGESMSASWRRATGQHMIGAIGRTDYSGSDAPYWHPQLSGEGGRWTN